MALDLGLDADGGSALIPLLLGIALGDLLHGLPINKDGNYAGTFWDLFTPYGVWVGLTLLALTVTHGVMYLSLKTTGAVQQRAQRVAGPAAWVAVLAVTGFHLDPSTVGPRRAPEPCPDRRLPDRRGVSGTATPVKPLPPPQPRSPPPLGSILLSLYSNVMVSSTNPAYNLTVSSTAASNYALTVMTVVAVIFVPLVLAYEGWSYYVFRARVKAPPAIPAGSSPPSTAVKAPPAIPAGSSPPSTAAK